MTMVDRGRSRRGTRRGTAVGAHRISGLAVAVALVASSVTGAIAFGSAPASAADNKVTLKVVVEAVRALDSLDSTTAADFYPEITLAGSSEQGGGTLEITDDNEIEPNWTFTTLVEMPSAASTAGIHLELYDADGALNGPRDHVDITSSADRDLDLTVNLTDCALKDPTPVSGDVSGKCGPFLVTSGTDSDRASVKFDVTVDAPDADGDGLLDVWEVQGLDVDGDGRTDVDLPSMGADPAHKDLFLELDITSASRLSRDDVLAMKTAFAAAPVDAGTLASQLPGGVDARPNPDGRRGITLHVDTGSVVDGNAREGQPMATCANGIDDGRDGITDAADADCSGAGAFLDDWSPL